MLQIRFRLFSLTKNIFMHIFFQSGAWPLGQAASSVVLPAELRKIVQEVEYSYHFLKIVHFISIKMASVYCPNLFRLIWNIFVFKDSNWKLIVSFVCLLFRKEFFSAMLNLWLCMSLFYLLILAYGVYCMARIFIFIICNEIAEYISLRLHDRYYVFGIL